MKISFALIIITLILLSSCAVNQKVITLGDNNSAEVITNGTKLKVQLKSNSSTGYKWFYKIENEGVVKFISSEYKYANADSNLVGAPGATIFDFEGVGEGNTEIAFVYARPWQMKQAADSLKLAVSVDAKRQVAITKK